MDQCCGLRLNLLNQLSRTYGWETVLTFFRQNQISVTVPKELVANILFALFKTHIISLIHFTFVSVQPTIENLKIFMFWWCKTEKSSIISHCNPKNYKPKMFFFRVSASKITLDRPTTKNVGDYFHNSLINELSD